MALVTARDDCRLVAVADPHPNGSGAAAAFAVPLYDSVDAALDATAPDGVIVAVPNALHVPVAAACIARGVPILLEKPISDSVESGYALADQAEARRVPILVGHHRRHNPIIGRARAIVASGRLGEVVAISASWLARKPDDYFAVRWRGEPGGGPLLINLIHDIDSLRFIAGEIVAVQAVASSRRRGLPVEDTAAVLLEFANGAIGTIILSDATPSPWSWELTSGEATSYTYPRVATDTYRVAGSLAALGLPSLRTWRHDGAESWQSPLIEERLDVPGADPLAIQMGHFRDVIRGRAAPIITARDAARTLEVTLAIGVAARTRSVVDLSARISGGIG